VCSSDILVFRNSKTNEIGTFVKVGKKGDKYVYGRLDSAFVGKTIYSLPDISGDEKMGKAEVFVQSINEFINETDISKPKESNNLMLCNG
jgi:hypothetical protein